MAIREGNRNNQDSWEPGDSLWVHRGGTQSPLSTHGFSRDQANLSLPQKIQCMAPTLHSATDTTHLFIPVSFSVVLLTSFCGLPNDSFISWHCFSFEAVSQVSGEFMDELFWDGTPTSSPGAGAEKVWQWGESCLVINPGLLSSARKWVWQHLLEMATPYVLVQPPRSLPWTTVTISCFPSPLTTALSSHRS